MMNYVNFLLKGIDDSYSCKNSSDIKISILGEFLARDVGSGASSFKNWFFDPNSKYAGGNLTTLRKESGYIFLGDAYPEEEQKENPIELKMTYAQFLQILDDWEEKVMKLRPEKLIIKYENDEFIFETKN